jgi:hypothetical protein
MGARRRSTRRRRLRTRKVEQKRPKAEKATTRSWREAGTAQRSRDGAGGAISPQPAATKPIEGAHHEALASTRLRRAVPSAHPHQSRTYTSRTPPSEAVVGDVWTNKT